MPPAPPSALPTPGPVGFGGWGSGFEIWDLGFGVQGLGFGVWGSGSKVGGSCFIDWGLGFEFSRFEVEGFGFRVTGLGVASQYARGGAVEQVQANFLSHPLHSHFTLL